MSTFILTCGTCACYVTSGFWGWDGVRGDVNVDANLRHMRKLRHVRGLGLGKAVSIIILGYTHMLLYVSLILFTMNKQL